MANEQDKPEERKIPPAKRNELLMNLSEQLSGMKVNTTAEIVGHKYYMETLTADESVWADSHTNMNSEVSFVSSQKAPRIAAAIKRIDGKPVEELFEFPEDMDEELKKYHTSTQYRKRYWVMAQIFTWLSEQADPFIDALWTEYAAMADKRNKNWDDLKKSCARTPGGESEATSSPEKESSQVTQTSEI
jgi:hypothetical protein